MDFLTNIKARAKSNKKTIVLPEAYEKRTLDATDMILKEDMANIILIGNKDKIIEAGKGCDLSKATIIDLKIMKELMKLFQLFVKPEKAKDLLLKRH